MALAVGRVEYTLGAAPVTGCGLSWTAEELDAALAEPIAAVVFDDVGAADCSALIERVLGTEFDPCAVKRILEGQKIPEEWRVGEALAEAYLISHRVCKFPWPDGRDARKSGSSLPGAD